MRTGNIQSSVQPSSQRSKQSCESIQPPCMRACCNRIDGHKTTGAAEAQPGRARSLSDYYPRSRCPMPEETTRTPPSPPSFGRRLWQATNTPRRWTASAMPAALAALSWGQKIRWTGLSASLSEMTWRWCFSSWRWSFFLFLRNTWSWSLIFTVCLVLIEKNFAKFFYIFDH